MFLSIHTYCSLFLLIIPCLTGKKKKRERERDTRNECREKRQCKDTAKSQSSASQGPQEKPDLPKLDLGFLSLQNSETIEFCWLSPPGWFCYSSSSRVMYHLRTRKTVADLPSMWRSARRKDSGWAGPALTARQGLVGTSPPVSLHNSRPREGSELSRQLTAAWKDLPLGPGEWLPDFCFSPSWLKSHQFPLQRRGLINHSAQLRGSRQGRVTLCGAVNRGWSLWLCEMFTTETFVSQTALGLLK